MIAADVVLRFIIDEPAKVDFLDTHLPVAVAISDAIAANDDLKIIGLRGRWGSGKSTIIRQMRDRLSDLDEKFIVFSYDAWLHQHDPLRRSFMEALVRFLADRDALSDRKKWRKRLRKLSGELEETKRYDKPVITGEAKLFFFLAAFFALGLQFWSKETVKAGAGGTIDPVAAVALAFGILLTAGPIAFWLLRFVWKTEKNPKAPFFPTLLFNRNFSRVHTLTQKPIEPTSIEFGRSFRKLMKEVEAKGKHLIIVIDNMDRVDDKETMNIWANVRSFFLSTKNDDLLGNAPYHPTLILPIDGDSISDLFAVGNTPEQGKKLARSFINKTFDVTFDVPTPVMSDWRRYLDEKLAYCLGAAYSDDRSFTIKQFLDAWFIQTATPITPREINKIINRIVALLMQWRSSPITFETLVWFSINRDQIGKIETEVGRGGHALTPYSTDWARELAALHFGVALPIAGQVLMTQPINDAIVRADGSLLDPYRNLTGFGDIFEQVTASLPFGRIGPSDRFTIITNASRLLGPIEGNAAWQVAAWKNLLVNLNTVSDFSDLPRPEDLFRSIQPFFDHATAADARQFVDTATLMINHTLVAHSYGEVGNAEIGKLGSSLLSFAEKFQLEKPIFTMKGDISEYLKRLARLSDYPEVQQRFRTDAMMEMLVSPLASLLSDPLNCLAVPSLARLLSSPAAEAMMGERLTTPDPLYAQAEQILRSHGGETEPFRAAVHMLLTPVASSNLGMAALRRLGTEGVFAPQLAAATAAASDDESVVAVMFAALLLGEVAIPEPAEVGWRAFLRRNPGIPAAVNLRLDELLENEFPIDCLQRCYEAQFGIRDFVSALMNERVESGRLGNLDPEKTLANLSSYSRMLDWVQRDEFARMLARHRGFYGKVESAEWNSNLLETATLLDRQGGDEAVRYRAILVEKVGRASAKAWEAAISRGSEPFRIATELLNEKEVKLGINSALVAALRASAPSVATGPRAPMLRWFALAVRLSHQGRRAVFETLRGIVFDLSPSAKIKLLKLAGPRFLAEGGFEESADDTVANLVLVLARSKDGRAWLKDRSAWVRKIYAAATEEARARLASIIDEHAKAANEERRHWAEIISKILPR